MQRGKEMRMLGDGVASVACWVKWGYRMFGVKDITENELER